MHHYWDQQIVLRDGNDAMENMYIPELIILKGHNSINSHVVRQTMATIFHRMSKKDTLTNH